MSSTFILRLDDITATMDWEALSRMQRLLEDCSVPALIGVVPSNEDPSLDVGPPRTDFWSWVRERRQAGWTVAQHGYRHVYDSAEGGVLRRRPASEFAGHDYDTQRERLSEGRKILVEQGVWQPVFMAPGHTFDHVTLRALRDTGFRVVTDGYGAYPYVVNSMILVPQLTFRPFDPGFGVWTLCVHLNTITDVQFQRLERFVRSRADSFTTIGQAARVRAPALLPAATVRTGSMWALKGVHSARDRVRA